FERRAYDRWLAYGQSKTANVLFAVALDARGRAHGVRGFALHPGGIVATGLGKHMSRDELRASGVIDDAGNPVIDPARNLKTVEQGAATSVWCATSPQLAGMGGVYCENCDITPIVGQDDVANRTGAAMRKVGARSLGVMPYAIDPDAAARLWALSARLTG